MAKYDLTGSLETSFTFNIGDKEFTFRKPTVREMRSVTKGFSAIDTETDPVRQSELAEKAMAGLYQFITPNNHSFSIEDVLNEQPVDVQIAFNEMIQKELGANQ